MNFFHECKNQETHLCFHMFRFIFMRIIREQELLYRLIREKKKHSEIYCKIVSCYLKKSKLISDNLL